MKLRAGVVYSFAGLAIFLLFIFYCGLIIKQSKSEIDLHLNGKLENLEGQIEATQHDYVRFSNYVYDEIVNQEPVTSLLAAAKHSEGAERDALRQQLLDLMQEHYETMQRYNFRQLHFHFSNCDSFLRMHRPEKYGDSLLGVRQSLEKANELKQFVSGFEEGRIYNGFRYVYPISYRQEHLGTVEVSVSAETILESLYEIYPEMMVYFMLQDNVVTDKVFISELSNYFPSDVVDGYMFDKGVHDVVSIREKEHLGAISEPLKAKIRAKIGPHPDFKKPCNFLVSHVGRAYLVQICPVVGISGKQVAVFVAVCEDQMVPEVKRKMGWRLLSSGIVFGMLMIAILMLMIYHHRVMVAQRKADKANASKSRFLANMSHEIRTPIGGIKGMLSLMGYTDLSEEQKEYIGLAASSADTLLGVVNEILDISKIEAGELVLESKAFRVRPVIERAIHLFQPTAQDKGVQLICKINPDVPEVLCGDPLKIHQILNNLISNALKFTSEGEVSLRVSLLEVLEDGRSRLKVVVSDTGIGMSESAMERVFDPYVQAESSTARQFGGTGLGLPITRELIRRMGGDIAVESRVGEGTSMRFTLILAVWDGRGEVIDPTPVAPKTVESSARPLKQPKILIAEDSMVNRKIMETLLTKEGYAADLVVNGQAAVAAAKEKQYDLIFMDCQMPLMDGYEATRQIRRMEASGMRAKIVALTAHAFKGEDDQCYACGMDGYLSKPFELSAVLKEICSVV